MTAVQQSAGAAAGSKAAAPSSLSPVNPIVLRRIERLEAVVLADDGCVRGGHRPKRGMAQMGMT